MHPEPDNRDPSKHSSEVAIGDGPHHAEIFFEGWRGQRHAYYATRTPNPRKSRAVVTMVHNEPIFLPIWLRFYSQFFAPEDIHVLDNETDDGSTDGGDFVRVQVTRSSVDHRWMVGTVAEYQHELLNQYDVVLVTDVDEIVIPDPSWGTLGEYIDRFDEPFVNAFGYELIDLVDREAPYRSDKPILGQRRYWFANDAYSKPALASEPMDWNPGFHSRSDSRTNFDPDLRLIHLHRMDYAICRDRHQTRSRRRWATEDIAMGWASHNRIAGRQAFDRWFYRDLGIEGSKYPAEIQKVPRRWLGAF